MTGPVEWPAVQGLLDTSDYRGLVALTEHLDDKTRKALTPMLKKYARRPPDDWQWHIDEAAASLAGAALLPNASAVVAWLLRHEPFHYNYSYGDVREVDVSDRVGDVLIARGDEWLPAIVAGLGDKFRYVPLGRGSLALFTVIERLRRHADAAPPQGEGYLAQWAMSATSLRQLRTRLTEEPRFVPLVPLLFQIDDVARELDAGSEWAAWTAALVADGTIDRDDVLDAVLVRLQRPGKPGIFRGVLSVLTALAVTIDEVERRVPDYLALLSVDLSTVAGHAQSQLLALDGRTRLSSERLSDMSQAVFARSEKKIVRAQLVHLRRVAGDRPADIATWAAAAALALSHPAADVQADAIAFIAAVAGDLDDSTRTEVLERGSLLAPDLAARLATAVQATPDPLPAVAPADGPRTAPAATLDPVASPAELAEVLLRVLHVRTAPDPAQVEQVLEGVVRFAATMDPGELRSALQPVVQTDWYRYQVHPVSDPYGVDSGESFSRSAYLASSLLYLAAAALGDEVPAGVGVLHEHGHRGPGVAVLSRIHSLIRDVRTRSIDGLVSFPTYADGRIEPGVLAERLARARDEHAPLSATDVDAALLRVGPTDHEQLLAELGRLGRTPTEHLPTRFELRERIRSDLDWNAGPDQNRVLSARPTAANPPPDSAAPGARLDPRTYDRSIRDCYSAFYVDDACWPLIAPHHRELLASWYRTDNVESLPALAACRGEMGPALALVIARALTAGKPAAAANAVDAMVLLAARNELDDDALSSVLVTLLRRGEIKLARLTAPLREAASAGIAPHIWRLVVPAVEYAITSESVPAGTPDLLALATELALTVRPDTVVAGLDELADRKGRTRQVAEARRLRDALGA